jgi:hypothetical protein
LSSVQGYCQCNSIVRHYKRYSVFNRIGDRTCQMTCNTAVQRMRRPELVQHYKRYSVFSIQFSRERQCIATAFKNGKCMRMFRTIAAIERSRADAHSRATSFRSETRVHCLTLTRTCKVALLTQSLAGHLLITCNTE